MNVNQKSFAAMDVKGFSLIELLIVLTLIMIMSGVSFFYFNTYQRLYKPDDQSLQIVDILQEARQHALTQRETIRVEVDITVNVVRLIDENTPITANDNDWSHGISGNFNR